MVNRVLAVARRAMRVAVRLPLRLVPSSATVRVFGAGHSRDCAG